MAEAKGSAALARSIQKTLGRTKAKVLQSLGKADKTTDEIFKSYVGNFERQQHVAGVLQKELKHYLQCVKAMTVAANNLYETILQEVYEPEWTEQIFLANSVKSLDMLYANYEAELSDRVYSDLLGYLGRFPDYKEKISKRSRKLLDYDNARHENDAVQNAKKKDDAKIAKARETLSEAKHTYEDLNTELHRELPEFYDHRVAFSAANLQALFRAESTFHLESGKITDQLTELAGRLATEFSEGQHRLKIPAGAVLSRDPTIDQQSGEGGGSYETGAEYVTMHDENPVDLSMLSAQSRPDASHSDSENDTYARVDDFSTASSAPVSGEPASSGGSGKLPQRPAVQPKNRAPSIKVAAASAASTASQSRESDGGNVQASNAATGSSEPLYAQLVTHRSPAAPPPPPPPGHLQADVATAPAPPSAVALSSAGVALQQQQEPDAVSRPAAAADRSSAVSLRSTAAGGGAAGSSSDVGQRLSKNGAGNDDGQAKSSASADGPGPQQQAEPGSGAAIVIAAKPADEVAAPSVSTIASTVPPPTEPPQPAASDKVRQVVATHAYTAEDDDELTFEPGEIITLVPFDDPEDQDEGWEMGVKVSNGRKGVFPANFTRPL